MFFQLLRGIPPLMEGQMNQCQSNNFFIVHTETKVEKSTKSRGYKFIAETAIKSN